MYEVPIDDNIYLHNYIDKILRMEEISCKYMSVHRGVD